MGYWKHTTIVGATRHLYVHKGPVRYPQSEISQYADVVAHSDHHHLDLGSNPYQQGEKVGNRLIVMRGLSSRA